MTDEQTLKQYDDWLVDNSECAALVMQQWLQSVEGKKAVFFPPTYLKPDGMKQEDWTGYNLDRLESVCQIDSVGSQANRMEPIFKRQAYSELVPQVIIEAGDKKVNLLDAGHRAADAIVRFAAGLSQEFADAFRALGEGNAEPMAKIAPTSLVFGMWDSRASQVKVPRVVRSVVRAYQIDVLHRSATYVPPVDYVGVGLLDPPTDKKQQDSLSEQGLSHAPASWSHGGIRLAEKGEIRRDATLNLEALRALGAASENASGTSTKEPAEPSPTLKLRRYILGLSLVSFTAPQETFLREGCQLVPDRERHQSTEWNLIHHDGSRVPFSVSHDGALAYARAAANAFVVGPNRKAAFTASAAKGELSKTKDERKAGRRRGATKPRSEDSDA